MLIGTARPAYSVQQLIHSVSTLWDMQLPPEFVCSQFINNRDDDCILLSLSLQCLSSMEDGLMALNEQGQMISTGLLEEGCISDLSRSLKRLHNSLKYIYIAMYTMLFHESLSLSPFF